MLSFLCCHNYYLRLTCIVFTKNITCMSPLVIIVDLRVPKQTQDYSVVSEKKSDKGFLNLNTNYSGLQRDLLITVLHVGMDLKSH